MISLLYKNKHMFKKVGNILPRFYLLLLSVSFLGALLTPSVVSADQYTQQIQALEQTNSQVQQNLSGLQIEASSYQQAIDNLNVQIAAMQAQIAQTQEQISVIQGKIQANQLLLAQEKSTLANIIQSMYVDGHMTALESLATSANLSDFVTKIEYKNIVQQQIQGYLSKIKQIQLTLGQQNETLSIHLSSQTQQNNALTSEQNQQNNLLSMDQVQQASYNQQLQTNNAKVAQLQAVEAAIIAADQGGGTIIHGNCGSANDTYPEPWCSASQDSMLDTWGMDNRECVSYAAWMVYSTGKYMPKWGYQDVGNAGEWIADAENDGIPVSRTPQAGDVAILPATGPGGVSPVGHAMYVMGVNSDGTIDVSQYNADDNGDFSEVLNINPSFYYYIDFPPAT